MQKNIKKYFTLLIICSVVIFFFTACEKEIDLNTNSYDNAIVVEGHIENDLPPFVLLTKSTPFYGNLNLNNIASYFVTGAIITVSTDDDSVQLVEYNAAFVQSLPDSVIVALAAQFGLSIDSAADFPDISIYTISPADIRFFGRIGKRYDLRIEVDGKTLTSTTTIPQPVSFDSLWQRPHPNPSFADSFFQLYGRLSDPIAKGNYYRYFTKADSSTFLVSDRSVFDDGPINGLTLDYFIPKGHPVGQFGDQNFNTSGYWSVNNDRVCTVKLCMIDKAHYDFWRTLEANRQSQGNPFGSTIYVKTNINGGLGIWGGYGSITTSLVRF
jgi:Domain of unknown function (DUF4249)